MFTRREFLKTTALGAGIIGSGAWTAEAATRKNTSAQAVAEYVCLMPSHKVPLIASVDVLIIGGSSGAVAAAVEAAGNGASVFLASSLPYLGDDICGTLRLWHTPTGKEEQLPPLAAKIFTDTASPVTPLHVKTVLEDELINNGVQFLYSSYFANVLYDKKGKPAGGLIVNRSGCQAIAAKTLIDASTSAVVARACKLPLTGKAPDRQQYEFTVVGNTRKTDEHIVQTEELPPVRVGDKSYPALRYTFEFAANGSTCADLCLTEQQIRDITWDPDQVDSADELSYVPWQQVKSNLPEAFQGKDISVEALKPQGIPNLYLLNGYADVTRDTVRQLQQPSVLIALGIQTGKAITAVLRAGQPEPVLSSLDIQKLPSSDTRNIKASAREINVRMRPNHLRSYLKISSTPLPVLGSYDLVVLGGGTSGASVGISAARQGIKTLTLEYLHGLGGMTTLGLVGRYWEGFLDGFTKEIDEGVRNMAPAEHPRQMKKRYTEEWPADWKMEWFRRQTRRAGGDIWFGAIGCGAVVEGNRVCGVVVATPYGRGVVLAKHVADSTGSADIAIAAGAGYGFTDQHSVATQGAGLGERNPGDHYNNTDWTFIDDSDVWDVSRVFVSAKAKYKGMYVSSISYLNTSTFAPYDIGKIPQTRERRRVKAEHIISVLDVVNGRRYPDTISYHRSSFDTHGFIIDPYLTLKPSGDHNKKYDADVPLRTLLPQGLEGIIVTGLGTGAHRDAMPIIRMQPCLQNQGFAVGYLIAVAVKENKTVRQVDIKKIQQYLVAMGNLPERVLTDKDNFPFSDAQFMEAASNLHNNMEGLEILLTEPQRAIPLLKQAFKEKAGTPQQLNYAQILAMLGEFTGIDVLMKEINRYGQWDPGWNYMGMSQWGACMSRLDSLIMALGYTGKKEALPAVMMYAKQLKPDSTLSHFRSVCVAFETIGDKTAAPVLKDIILSCNIKNEAVVTDYIKARSSTNNDVADTSVRNRVLKELHLARALYRCGDMDGMGETILKAYANDLHHHYALHAQSILL
jgi:flavin-dependent dehydrogenase